MKRLISFRVLKKHCDHKTGFFISGYNQAIDECNLARLKEKQSQSENEVSTAIFSKAGNNYVSGEEKQAEVSVEEIEDVIRSFVIGNSIPGSDTIKLSCAIHDLYKSKLKGNGKWQARSYRS